MLDVGVDGQGLLPRVLRLRQVARGAADLADVGKDPRFYGPVALVPDPGQGVFEVPGGRGGLAQLEFDVAERVPDAALEVAAAELGYQGE